jgi:hypothetical protein
MIMFERVGSSQGWKTISALVRVGLIAVVLTACGLTTHYPVPSGPMTTLIPGWERYFSIEWTVEPEQQGSRRLDGYVFNQYGEYAADVRLLVQALDASGAVVDQRIVWGPIGVGGFGRAYFDVRHLPAADHYQVFVWDYRRIQAAALMR